MGDNTRIHDGIVGILVLGGILLGVYVHLMWLWVPGIVGALLIQSSVTGFCPVYYTLGKIRPSSSSGHTGAAH